MYKLIADSGATKTDWASTANGKVKFFSSAGLNPHLLSDEEIVAILKEEVFPQLETGEMAEVLFYGSGCADPSMKNRIMQCFMNAMPTASIQVSTDLEAAGIALFGDDEGLACILGTGSNAGIYSGGLLIKQMKAEVFPEGDKGGGAAIILAIIKDVADMAAPEEVRNAVEILLEGSPEEYLYKLENDKVSRTDVASLYKKMAPLYDNEYFRAKVKAQVSEFIEEVSRQFKDVASDLSWGFIGSIALLNEQIIREIANEKGIEIRKITGRPIEELHNYLSEKYD
ncbi:hypothetical protein AB2B38_011825 [Balneola sp. MJW-20]|uniref:hypothetical protein n=1 Tax=Gracilimonas aurantiaca TaxID=3234185 RepID=UPI003465121A